MPRQWRLPGPASAYLVVWSYDKAAKDTNRHVSTSAVRTALDQWIRSRRQVVREIYEALEGNQSLGLSGGKKELRDDQLKARLTEAFSKGRLVVLVAEESSTSKDQKKPQGNVMTRQVPLLAPLAGASGAPRVKKIIQCEDFLLLLLDDQAKTRVTVPVNLSGKLQPGTYKLNNANGKVTLPSSGTVPPPLSEWLPPNVSLPAQVDYFVVNPWVRLPELAHRLQATPMVAKAPIGTKFVFSVHMDREIGGTYKYKWKTYRDPATSKKNGVDEVLDGPTKPMLESKSIFVGRHRIVCELTFVGSNRTSKEVPVHG